MQNKLIMPSYEEGCLVLLRSTQRVYRVLRWDRETELLLLTPSGEVDGGSPSKSTTKGKRSRSQLAFEHMVDLVEPQPEDPRLRNDVTDNPTPYAQRAAKLDSRVEIRRNQKHGRGLFALRNIPAGTEVMRVPAAAAVSIQGKGSCCGCLLSTSAVGPLETCPGCSLSFCASCKNAATASGTKAAGVIALTHSGAMCELTKEFFGICTKGRGGAGPDHGSLRLLADVVVKRKAGVIDDEEWDLLISLESHDNKAGAMSLARPELENCVRLFKRLMDVDIPKEDVQAMYRRQVAAITRNAHAVAPNAMATEGGSVQGLFPCGALANHSCRPNTFFHCVADPAPAMDGAPAIKQVLRTVCDVKAGDELCYSYLSSSAASGNVLERRGLLEGWGFRCSCERCDSEAVERGRLERVRTPIDETAMKILETLGKISRLVQGRGKASALKEGTLMPHLEKAVEFYTREAENGLSWVLRDYLALALFETTELVGISNFLLRFGVCGFAADVLSQLRLPTAMTCRYQQYVCSTKIRAGDLSTSQPNALKVYEEAGRQILRDAERLQNTFYGGKGTKQRI
ncbi:unnamed protein product [Scytosiphon promiscuus]